MIKLSSILLIIAWIFIIFGIIGIFKFKKFYSKLLTSSKIDSASVILIFSGLMLTSKDWFFISRFLLIMIFILITNPVTTHLIAKKKYLEKK
ncbi:MAG: monovalent cation/H(+) antiporter subunit G [Clostridiales bacterium]|nr:monovalent cation/H(+) antiporter subunit G [Clostridiales bacterium]